MLNIFQKTEEGEECEAKPADDSDIPDLPNENPILASLSEDATEEEGGEEMELMGTASPTQGESGDKPEVDLSRDSGLLRVLDRLVLYLRVVHSLDYYNGLDYPYEDEMPNRCGIIHVRGATPEKCTLAEGMTSNFCNQLTCYRTRPFILNFLGRVWRCVLLATPV